MSSSSVLGLDSRFESKPGVLDFPGTRRARHFAGEVASHLVPRLDFLQRRLDFSANSFTVGAPGLESATDHLASNNRWRARNRQQGMFGAVQTREGSYQALSI